MPKDPKTPKIPEKVNPLQVDSGDIEPLPPSGEITIDLDFDAVTAEEAPKGPNEVNFSKPVEYSRVPDQNRMHDVTRLRQELAVRATAPQQPPAPRYDPEVQRVGEEMDKAIREQQRSPKVSTGPRANTTNEISRLQKDLAKEGFKVSPKRDIREIERTKGDAQQIPSPPVRHIREVNPKRAAEFERNQRAAQESQKPVPLPGSQAPAAPPRLPQPRTQSKLPPFPGSKSERSVTFHANNPPLHDPIAYMDTTINPDTKPSQKGEETALVRERPTQQIKNPLQQPVGTNKAGTPPPTPPKMDDDTRVHVRGLREYFAQFAGDSKAALTRIEARGEGLKGDLGKYLARIEARDEAQKEGLESTIEVLIGHGEKLTEGYQGIAGAVNNQSGLLTHLNKQVRELRGDIDGLKASGQGSGENETYLAEAENIAKRLQEAAGMFAEHVLANEQTISGLPKVVSEATATALDAYLARLEAYGKQRDGHIGRILLELKGMGARYEKGGDAIHTALQEVAVQMGDLNKYVRADKDGLEENLRQELVEQGLGEIKRDIAQVAENTQALESIRDELKQVGDMRAKIEEFERVLEQNIGADQGYSALDQPETKPEPEPKPTIKASPKTALLLRSALDHTGEYKDPLQQQDQTLPPYTEGKEDIPDNPFAGSEVSGVFNAAFDQPFAGPAELKVEGREQDVIPPKDPPVQQTPSIALDAALEDVFPDRLNTGSWNEPTPPRPDPVRDLFGGSVPLPEHPTNKVPEGHYQNGKPGQPTEPLHNTVDIKGGLAGPVGVITDKELAAQQEIRRKRRKIGDEMMNKALNGNKPSPPPPPVPPVSIHKQTIPKDAEREEISRDLDIPYEQSGFFSVTPVPEEDSGDELSEEFRPGDLYERMQADDGGWEDFLKKYGPPLVAAGVLGGGIGVVVSRDSAPAVKYEIVDSKAGLYQPPSKSLQGRILYRTGLEEGLGKFYADDLGTVEGIVRIYEANGDLDPEAVDVIRKGNTYRLTPKQHAKAFRKIQPKAKALLKKHEGRVRKNLKTRRNTKR